MDQQIVQKKQRRSWSDLILSILRNPLFIAVATLALIAFWYNRTDLVGLWINAKIGEAMETDMDMYQYYVFLLQMWGFFQAGVAITLAAGSFAFYTIMNGWFFCED